MRKQLTILAISLASLAGFTFTGCTPNAQRGALVGGGAGAVTGAVVGDGGGDVLRGAAIGAGLGSAAGYLYDTNRSHHHHRRGYY